MQNDNKIYYDNLEEKRREFSEFAFEQYKREGTLSGKALLRESNALDEVMNKSRLEERLSQYRLSVDSRNTNLGGKSMD